MAQQNWTQLELSKLQHGKLSWIWVALVPGAAGGNKLRRQFLWKFLYCPEIIPAVGHKEEAAWGARICFISPLTPPSWEILVAVMRITCCPGIWQWQPWQGGRLRSCLYFGAWLQPEGWLQPHGSQISKSIAPPRPPWTLPAPLRGRCSNLQKNATLVAGGIRPPQRGSATRINWGTGPANDLRLGKGLEMWKRAWSWLMTFNSTPGFRLGEVYVSQNPSGMSYSIRQVQRGLLEINLKLRIPLSAQNPLNISWLAAQHVLICNAAEQL